MTPCCYLVVKEEEELEMLRLYSDSQGLDLVHEIFDRSIVTYMCGHLQDSGPDVLIVSLLSRKLAWHMLLGNALAIWEPVFSPCQPSC